MILAVDKDKYILWYFIIFFGFVAVVNAIMITMAAKTYTGVVTDHPYEKGIAYNQVIDAARVQQQLGWKAIIELHGRNLSVIVQDKKGVVLKSDSITARFTRPTKEGMDFETNLGNGKAHINFPVNGLWDVRIFVNIGGQKFQQSKRVVVQ